tara:strand:- start:233 stop:454 length:222 start_codon:yes stop_codon:yes gene_type:complete
MTPKSKEAIIFSTVVSINNNGELVTKHESLPPQSVLKELGDDYYAHLISSIVKHCRADSFYFDEQLRNLLRSI